MDNTGKTEIDRIRILFFPLLIKNEETREIVLKDCNVVIDAYNFFFNSYQESGLLSTFGIEANAYAKYLKEKIEIFAKANVKCYFVFDGARTSLDKKIQNLQARNVNFEADKNNSFLFLREVWLELLKEINLKFATCVVGCKEDSAVLARKLRCPVLSDNILFCFKHVPYIPKRTLKCNYSDNNIICRQYELQDFLTKHSMTEKKTAMFAALTNVELFPNYHFDYLLHKWGVWDKVIYTQHKNLLRWLSKQDELKILKDITDFLSTDSEIRKFCDNVEELVNNMQSDNTSSLVTDYLYNDLRLSISPQDPLWFEKGVAAQKIPTSYISLYLHKFIKGSRALEKTVPTDSIMLSIDIIKYAYNLMTNYEKYGYFFIYQSSGSPVEIKTEELSIKKPVYDCVQTVFENGWADIQRLKLFEHFLNENHINIEKLNTVPDNARMLFIALAYFTRRKLTTEIKAKKEVYCYIISYILLNHPESVKPNVEKYFKSNPNEANLIFNADILDPLEELQYCLLHMNYLNELCGAPFLPTKYHTTYNGTLIYKLLRDMANCNPEEFICDLFQSSPAVLIISKKLINAYQQL